MGMATPPIIGDIAPAARDIVRPTYKTTVFDALYELIQSLELPPGRRLVEADLAARLGVSKTPIREALLLLEKERLVTLKPHVGATVSYLSLDDYEQQLFLQDALELPALALLVARITPEQLDSARALTVEIARAYRARDGAIYHQLVLRLHRELFASVRYARLSDMIDLVLRSIRRYHPVFVRPFPENWGREMETVMRRFEGIRAGDPAGAAAAVRRGHAEMFAFARARVEARDPGVMPYLAPDIGRMRTPRAIREVREGGV